MQVAIIGATGGTGRSFVEQALAANHEVTALARTPAKLQELSTRARIIQADGRDAASLKAALDGRFDAVVSIVGANGLLEARRVTDLYSVTTRNLIAAMQERQLSRLVVVSSGGVEPQPSDNWFYVHVLKRFFLGPMYKDMLAMERLLEASSFDYTIVRAPYLTGGAKPGGKYRVSVGQEFVDDKSLSRGDLAHFLLRSVEAPDSFRRRTVWISD